MFHRAIADYNLALGKGHDNNSFHNRAVCFLEVGTPERTVADLREATARNPESINSLHVLAWTLATWHDKEIRNGGEAVELARRACDLTAWEKPRLLETLAAAYAESADFASAVKFEKQALQLMTPEMAVNTNAGKRLELYESRQPFRQPRRFRPGELVVVVMETEMLSDGQVVDEIGRGSLLVVQAVESDWIRIKTQQAGWIPASSVVARDKAIEHFTKLIVADTSNQADLRARGRVWVATEDYDKAIDDFSASIAIEPGISDYKERAYCFSLKGDRERAIVDFTAALELEPDDVWALTNRGSLYEQEGEIDKALADYEAALATDPKYIHALQRRGGIRFRGSEFDKAIEDFTAAIQVDPGCIDCYVNRGESWIKENRVGEAIEDYTQALSLDETSLAALFNRGVAWHRQGQLDQALADFDRFLELEPQNLSVLHNRALLRIDRREYAEAIEDYDAALKIDPQNKVVLGNRARALTMVGLFDEAIASANAVIEKDPDDTIALFSRGVARQAIGQLEAALSDLDAAIASDPDHGEMRYFLYCRGSIRAMLDRHELAIEDFDKSIALGPNPTVYLGRGRSHQELGDYEKAVEDWRRAIEANPQLIDAYNALAWGLATWPDDSIRDGAEAVELARYGCELSDWKDGLVIDTLAAAYAETGNFESAVKYEEQAIGLLLYSEQVVEARKRLELFKSGKPYRRN